MPPKKVRCSVCGEEVLKSQTYHVGDGKRACKSHEGVQDKAVALKDQEHRRVKGDVQFAVGKKRFKLQQTTNPAPFDFTPRCFFCKHPGASEQEFAMASLVAMERVKMSGKMPNFFTEEGMKTIRDKHPLKGKRVLLQRFAKKDALSRMTVYRALGLDNQQVFDFLGGLVVVCSKCFLKWEKYLEQRTMPSAKELAASGAVYEVFMKPVVKLEAERQEHEDQFLDSAMEETKKAAASQGTRDFVGKTLLQTASNRLQESRERVNTVLKKAAKNTSEKAN